MLKWRKAWWWRDEEDGKLYLHPILAIGTLALTMPIIWFILDAALGK